MNLTARVMLAVLCLTACEAAVAPTGPGIHYRIDEGGGPAALIEGTIEITSECLFVTSRTGEVWSLILAPWVDTSSGVVDTATGAQIPSGSRVRVGGGEARQALATSEDVFPTPEACLTGLYWMTTEISIGT